MHDNSEDKDLVDKGMTLRVWLLWEREIGKKKLEHDHTKAGFALSVDPTVWEYAKQNNHIGESVQRTLDRLVRKLPCHPDPNGKTQGKTLDEIVDVFWTEFEDSSWHQGEFDLRSWFQLPDAKHERLHKRHEKYQLLNMFARFLYSCSV